MNALHKLARSVGTALVGLGLAGGISSLGCDRDEPERPMVEAAFWDEGREESAMIVALRTDASTGTSSPMVEGDVLQLDHGPQGGSHVEIEAEVSGLDGATTRIGARLERPDGTAVAELFQGEGFAPPGDPFTQRLFVIAFESTEGPLLLRVRARDASGAQGTTEVGVTVR